MKSPHEMSGLELLRAAVAGQHPRSSMAETMSMSFVEADFGRVKMLARADNRHLNPLGGVHGGFAATVLDSVTGCAVHSTLEAGDGYGTIDLQVKMLRPVPRDQELVAEAHTVHVSRNIATSEGTLKSADGKLLATATATCFLKRK
ncbi:PaaI family thioesterase [Cupriavidus necator]|uniref:PaaI family thioesterase n=1 Tax=Cupriavidus necator TaxID=106590 RepID=A0A367PIB4_CUPNE|nr:PaaI family thioesterase [Cupriavidus necator]QQX86654.1 PaaI family thioesterase [Cupriavidus necator]RCJ06845.1 PaaI family thioesterase [Cupriavidus necator]